jgi:exoribonuclease-2
MNSIVKNSLVVYKERPARVLSLERKKLVIQLAEQELKVRPKDILLLHPGPLQNLNSLAPINGEMLTAWELLQGQKTNLPELSELAFDQFTPQTAWACWLWVLEAVYFYAEDLTIYARSAAEVAEIQAAQAEKAAREAAWAAFIARLQDGRYAPADESDLQDVVDLALERRDKSVVLRALDRAQNRENAHQLLLEIGYWDEAVNPYPERLGVELTRPNFTLPPFPDEPRRDLTHLPAFAVDDEGSTDADDAVSWGEDGRLWVHIADVAALIPPDSPTDREARARGANLYLPEEVIPMLPDAATDMLALGRTERSPALSFCIGLDDAGEVTDVEITPSWIQVTALSYAEALTALHEPPLRDLLALAKQFQARRLANDAVVIDLPEAKVRVGEDGRVVVRPLPDSDSRTLVREAMLITGAAVAHFAQQHEIPLPYTIQDPPGWSEPPPANPSGMFARRKGMRRSQRSREPGRHAGLGMDAYVQATSPLRRYLDLVVHQQLRAFLRGEPLLDGAALIERVGMADAITGTLRAAERLSNRHWTLVYLRQNPDWTGDGIVVEERGRRCVVMLPDLALETEMYLDGNHGLNDTVHVQIDSVDLAQGEAFFRLAA